MNGETWRILAVRIEKKNYTFGDILLILNPTLINDNISRSNRNASLKRHCQNQTKKYFVIKNFRSKNRKNSKIFTGALSNICMHSLFLALYLIFQKIYRCTSKTPLSKIFLDSVPYRRPFFKNATGWPL